LALSRVAFGSALAGAPVSVAAAVAAAAETTVTRTPLVKPDGVERRWDTTGSRTPFR